MRALRRIGAGRLRAAPWALAIPTDSHQIVEANDQRWRAWSVFEGERRPAAIDDPGYGRGEDHLADDLDLRRASLRSASLGTSNPSRRLGRSTYAALGQVGTPTVETFWT